MCPVRSVSYVSGRSKGLQLCKPFCFPFICDQPHSIENAAERARLYREALTLEPNNVNAMIGLASTLAIRSQWIDSSDAARDKYVTDARDMALRIRAIDPRLRGIELPGQSTSTRTFGRCIPDWRWLIRTRATEQEHQGTLQSIKSGQPLKASVVSTPMHRHRIAHRPS